MSNEFWQALFGFLGLVAIAWMQNRTRNAVVKVGKDAAEHVNDVKDTLAANTDDTTKQLNTIHKLVNSSLGVPLKALALALRRTANETKSEDDIKAAETAEEASRAHEENQAKLDIQLAKGGRR